MKTKQVLLLSLVFIACGNPHVDVKSKDRLRLPSISEPSLTAELLAPQIVSKDESGTVLIKTQKNEESKTIQVVNPNAEVDLLISYKVEVGDNFKLKPGDCQDLLVATKSCNPEVVFSATKPGVYKDNLIVTYRSIKKPEESKNVVIPLIGERLEDALDPNSIKGVILADEEGKDSVSISTKTTPVERKLLATNPNEKEDLAVSYSLESGVNFRLDDNDCVAELARKTSCSPVVSFTAVDPGVYKDNVIATYKSKTYPEISKKVILPIMAEKLPKEVPVNPLLAPKVTTKEGQGQVSFSTLDKEHSVPMVVENVDPDDDILVTYKIENGATFRLDPKNCLEVLESTKSCSPSVIFTAEKPGLYKDHLIVVYSSKDRPEDKRQVVIPLNAEKTVVIPTDISLDITPNLGANGIDFGKSLVKQAISQLVEIRNPTDHDIAIVSRSIPGVEFELGKDGSCKKTIVAHKKCTVEVIFASGVVGISSTELTLGYASIYGGAEKKVTAKLLGEKIKDLNDCSGKPCGEPQKPGKLEFSSLAGQVLDFGVVGLNSKVKQSVPLFNTGDLALDVESVVIEGEGFELSHDCPKVLLPGHCNLEVSLLPKKEGSYSGVITAKTKDGQALKVSVKGVGKKMESCLERVVHHISAEPEYDLKKVVLPYVNSAPGTTAKIYDLYGTKVNNLVKSINRYTVKDSQVVTTFKIPNLSGKVEIVDFTLDTSKVVLDAHEDTEAVCLSSSTIRKCSGKDFDTSFIKLKNPKFWDKNAVPVNQLYEATLLSGTYKCGAYTCANMKKTFSANKLFDLSEEELASVLKDKVVSLIVTDDTRNMALPTLLITTSQACKNLK